MKPTFNQVTKNRYQKLVAKVYATLRGVPFVRVFKSFKAAESCAHTHRGIVVLL